MDEMGSQRRSAGEWQRHVEAQRRSGLSVAAYCQKHGLGESSFYTRVKRLLRARQEGGKVFVELAPGRPAPGTVSIQTPRGYRLEIQGRIREADLREIVAALS